MIYPHLMKKSTLRLSLVFFFWAAFISIGSSAFGQVIQSKDAVEEIRAQIAAALQKKQVDIERHPIHLVLAYNTSPWSSDINSASAERQIGYELSSNLLAVGDRFSCSVWEKDIWQSAETKLGTAAIPESGKTLEQTIKDRIPTSVAPHSQGGHDLEKTIISLDSLYRGEDVIIVIFARSLPTNLPVGQAVGQSPEYHRVFEEGFEVSGKEGTQGGSVDLPFEILNKGEAPVRKSTMCLILVSKKWSDKSLTETRSTSNQKINIRPQESPVAAPTPSGNGNSGGGSALPIVIGFIVLVGLGVVAYVVVKALSGGRQSITSLVVNNSTTHPISAEQLTGGLHLVGASYAGSDAPVIRIQEFGGEAVAVLRLQGNKILVTPNSLCSIQQIDGAAGSPSAELVPGRDTEIVFEIPNRDGGAFGSDKKSVTLIMRVE